MSGEDLRSLRDRIDAIDEDIVRLLVQRAAVVQQVNPDDNAGSVGIIDGRAALVPGIPVDVTLRPAGS